MTLQQQYQTSLNAINKSMQKCLKENKKPCTDKHTVQGKNKEENK